MEYSHERKSIDELKQTIRDQYGEKEAKDEARLLRFLIARDFDVNKAAAMLSNHITWRRKHGIDDLLHSYQPLEVLENYYPAVDLGFSKAGDIVVFLDFGGLDLIGFGKSVSKYEFTMYITHQMETFCKRLEEKSEKEGRLCQTWIFIFDFEKETLAQVTNKDGMSLLINLLPIYEANYPERLKAAYMINASLAFTVAYQVLKPLLYEKTRNKIKVFGKNGWKEELSSIIDPEVLPVPLGGTRTDPDGDPSCPTLLKRAHQVPHKYYFASKSEKSLSSKPGVKKYTVSRLSRLTIRVDVVEAGSKIEWEFQTENYEIGFGMRYVHVLEDGTKKMEDVMPVEKVDTRVYCETGMYHCERPGIYMLVFDNSFSWFRSKELYVRANIVNPNGQEVCATI